MASMPGRDHDPAADQPRLVAGRGEARQPAEDEVDLGDRRRASGCCRPARAGSGRSRPGPPAASRVRFGSMPATTARAVISSPDAERDPGRPAAARGDGDDLGARPDLDPGLARRRLQRGHAARRARPARRPSGRPLRRRCRRNRRAGPRSSPRTTAPSRCTGRHARRWPPGRRRVSKDSATKSAMAIGRTRVIVRPSSRPSPRNVRPRRSPTSASPRPGEWISGGARAGELAEEARRANGPAGRTPGSDRRRQRTGTGVPRRSGRRHPTARPRRRRDPGRRRGRPGRRATARGA